MFVSWNEGLGSLFNRGNWRWHCTAEDYSAEAKSSIGPTAKNVKIVVVEGNSAISIQRAKHAPAEYHKPSICDRFPWRVVDSQLTRIEEIAVEREYGRLADDCRPVGPHDDNVVGYQRAEPLEILAAQSAVETK